MTVWSRTFICVCILISTSHAVSQTSATYVPDELRPWVDWVLHGSEEFNCPFEFAEVGNSDDSFRCSWPGELVLTTSSSGATFSLEWTIYEVQQFIKLPGDAASWPENVRVNDSPGVLTSRDNSPALLLDPGSYRITGSFSWESMPRDLRIPAQIGLVSLAVNGDRIDFPTRNRGRLWLGAQQTEELEEDSITVEVYRTVVDDIPTRMITTLELDVSGSVREEQLGPVLPEGFLPLAMESDLPARIDADGLLTLQLRPGSWEVELWSRAPEVLDSLAMPEPGANMPSQEIWAYMPAPELRITAAEGPVPVDPMQIYSPDHMEELATFLLEAGSRMDIVERSRGLVDAANRLQLKRELYKSFDGSGFVFVDEISGDMNTGWRLNIAAPYTLKSAGDDYDSMLVTELDGQVGVELRSSELLLMATGTLDEAGNVPISGWDSRFDAVTVDLKLPPGHKLLAAPGADHIRGSWFGQWQLLDIFLLLIIVIAAWKLFGSATAAFALVGVSFAFHEYGAPLWTWLNLLAAAALVRVAPSGKLGKFLAAYRAVAIVLLALILVPFAAEQIRSAMYPQLERQSSSRGYAGLVASRDLTSERVEMLSDSPTAAMMRSSAPDSVIEEVIVTATKIEQSFSRYAENALVQTGPGTPNWSFNSAQLTWNSPVDPGSAVRLVIMPPWLTFLARLLMVAALLAFALRFALELLGKRNLKWLPKSFAASSILVPLIVVSTTMVPGESVAEVPPQHILQELQKRLLAPPQCVPQCAEFLSADVAISNDELAMTLVIHAEETVAVPLPGSSSGWRPEQLTLNGSEVSQVLRRQDDTWWVLVDRGRHELRLTGPLPPVDSLEVPFVGKPRIIEVQSEAWFVAGVHDGRLTAGSINITRQRIAAETGEQGQVQWESSRFPVFVRVERYVSLGIDWRVTTEVHRVAPSSGAITLSVPLLPGESVVSSDIEVSAGEAKVSMNPAEDSVYWRSTLARQSPLQISAGVDQPWKDEWHVGISQIWRVDFSGLPESMSDDDGTGRRATFFPRPGETLIVDVERPAAVAGETLAVDSANINVDAGQRSRNTLVQFNYRATRGAQHAVKLPEGAQLTEVMLDGESIPLRDSAGELAIPVLPGEHEVKIAWQNAIGVSAVERSSDFDLGVPASNVELTMSLPENRWILYTAGPAIGPAVLYWSELAALLIAAFLLSKIALTPLRFRDWVLLGLGFSTFSWTGLIFVGVWLLLAGAREKHEPPELSPRLFNLAQVFTVVTTLAAFFAIVTILPYGLLGHPDMHIAGGPGYHGSLTWFADRMDGTLPEVTVISAPMWAYKTLILVWALWLSFALMKWLPWAWQASTSRGFWRRKGYAPTESS